MMSCLVVLRGAWCSCGAMSKRHHGMISSRADFCGNAAHSLQMSSLERSRTMPYLSTAWRAQSAAVNFFPAPAGRVENTFCDTFHELHESIRKDNTSKDSFSQRENLQNLQGIHIQVKREYVGTLTTSEEMTRMQSDKHNNMFNVAANPKHEETHENNN